MKYVITLRWTAQAETPEDGDAIMRAASKCRELCRLVLDRPAMDNVEEAIEGTVTLEES